MPQYIRTKTGGKVIWDSSDFYKGIAYEQGNTNISNLPGSPYSLGLTAFRPEKYGLLTSWYAYSEFTNVNAVTGLIKDITTYYDGTNYYAYGIGDKLYRVDTDTSIISNSGVWPHTITGGIGDGVIVYKVNIAGVSTNKLFYSWYDGTDGDVGMYDYATTFDDDWWSTVPAGAGVLKKNVPHPIIEGKDKCLYVADGNLLKQLDGATGANGTVTTKLTLSPNYVITCFLRKGRYLYLGYYDSVKAASNFLMGECFVGVWDYASGNLLEEYPIKDTKITALFNYNGSIFAFTCGRTGTTQSYINKLAGDEFVIERKLYDTSPSANAVDVYDRFMIWMGGLYGTGYLYDGNNLHSFSSAPGGTAGVLKQVVPGAWYIAAGTSAFYFGKFSTGFYSGGSYHSEWVRLPRKSFIKKAIIYCHKLITDNSLTVEIRINKSVSGGKNLGVFLNYAVDGAITSKSALVELSNADSAAFVVGNFNSTAAPAVERFEIEFESTNIF